ncbi:MAG: aryl-sulfate sulfotransferase [Bacteroidales bacterium]
MKSYSLSGFVFFLISAMLIGLFGCQDEPVENGKVDMSDLLDQNSEVEIHHNPHGITPLSSELRFVTKEPVKAQIEVRGELPVNKSWEQYTDNQVVPVLGLYPGTTNEVYLKISTEEGLYAETTLQITTDSLPEYFPQISIDVPDEGMAADGMVLNNMVYANGNNTFRIEPFIFDKNGQVRWWLDLSEQERIGFPVERLENGNIIAGFERDIYEYSMTGEIMNHISLSSYHTHHDIIELPGGNLACAVTKDGTSIEHDEGMVNSVEDHFIEISRNAGTILQEWDLREILDVDRDDVAYSSGDWFHQNALWYDMYDDAYLVSGRQQGVIKTDRNNDLQWILAPHYNWGNAGAEGNGQSTEPYLLTAVDVNDSPYSEEVQLGNQAASDFDWPWGQHACMLLENGNILLYDNGVNRQFQNPSNNHSRAVEYDINESEMTVKQVWQYGKERGPEFHSYIVSDVDVLDNGNRFITSGTVNHNNLHYASLTEISIPDNTEVFEATVFFKDELGTNAGGWGDFDLIYRSEKLSLYPADN